MTYSRMAIMWARLTGAGKADRNVTYPIHKWRIPSASNMMPPT